MGKKPAQKMSMADLAAKFGGNMADQQLPSQSVGKDFGKAKGKGFRDIDGGREADDWRSSGPRKGKGKGDGEPSRADAGDWRGGGRDDRGDRGGDRGGFGGDRGGFGGDRGGFGGDRGDRGGGGFGRRDREDNTQAGKDDDWRGSMGRRDDDDRRGGFGDRRNFDGRGDRGGDRGGERGGDRGGDRGGSRADEGNWRSGGGGGGGYEQSERPRLNLKPRSKPVPEGGEARIEEEPQEPKDSEDKKPAAALGGGGKFIPSAKLREMKEEAAKKEQRDREQEDRRSKQREMDRQMEEEKERKKEEMRSRQKAEEERRHREEEARKEKKREEEARKAEADKQRKLEMKVAKEAEAKEKREALKSASQAQKKSSQNSGKKQVFDASKITSFVETCQEVVKEDGNVKKLVDEVDDLLTEDEWSTVHPIARLNEMLMQHCRGKQDDEVFSLIKSWAPMLNCLIEKSGIRRFKVKVLIEAQRVATKMGLPRLSPASALLEAFFDGLYRAEVIEEDYFEMWAVADDDTAGKTSAMFQVTAFLDWMRGIEEAAPDQEGEGEEEEDDEDDEEVEEDEIEANVPTSRRR